MSPLARPVAGLLLAALLAPSSVLAQKNVKGPRKVTPDSIEITITGVRLRIADRQLEFKNSPTPRLYPTGSREAQIWFALGFMLDSCRVDGAQRVGSNQAQTGVTLNRLTFRCHYKASEFRSAVTDLMD